MSLPAATPSASTREIAKVSFDVFDTCLARRVGPPSELFRVVGHRFAEQAQIADVETFANDFVEWRREAERRARRRSAREEVRLTEIWQELQRMLDPANASAIDGVALELDAERATLFAVESMRRRVARERAAGRGILFVSDCPLPADFLGDMLRTHGLATAEDRIYVSSEIGAMKRSGSLFRHVLAQENIAPAQLLHIGNDPDADIAPARAIGIRAELFTASAPRPIERFLLTHRPVADAPWIAAANGLRAARLAQDADREETAPEKFVRQFVGPFLCTFGHWLLRRAAEDSVQRLYFASRDARLLWATCRQLATGPASSIDLRYLLTSRQAVMFPAVTELTPAGLPWLRRDFLKTTLPRLLAKLELTYEECAETWLKLRPGWEKDAVIDAPLDWAAFWKMLRLPPIAMRIRARAQQRRTHAQDYFRQVGLIDPVSTGFVDLGWFLSCQHAINQLRHDAAPNLPPLRGYYLGLKLHRRGPAEAGPATGLFREPADDLPAPASLGWLQRTYLIDQIFGLAEHPSVSAYGPNGTVEYLAASETMDRETFQQIERALADYVGTHGACWAHLAQDDSQAAAFLGALINDMVTRPTNSALRTLSGLAFSPDPGKANFARLIESYTWAEACRLTFSRPSGVERRHRPELRWWPEASLKATSPAIRRFLQLATWAHKLRRPRANPDRQTES